MEGNNEHVVGEGRRRRRKVAAVLAGGLVVGVGVAATLASWNDSELAAGTFTAGHFALEGSTDGGANYSEHPSSNDAATLTFETSADNLAPGDWVNSEFKVRLDAASTNSGTVKVKAAATSGELTGTAFYVWQEPSGSCSGATYDASRSMAFSYDDAKKGFLSYGNWTLNNPTYDPDDPASEPVITLKKSAVAGEAGQPMTICVAVLGSDRLKQSISGAVTWQVTATSITD